MQASLEAEARGKAESLRVKKKLETDINELEVALDGANRGRAESEQNTKRYQAQIRELQSALEEEQHARDESREQFQVSQNHNTIAGITEIRARPKPAFDKKSIKWATSN